MTGIRVAVQVAQEQADYPAIRRAAAEAEAIGADAVFNWDHFYPLGKDRSGAHFECWTMLGAWAESTERAQIGPLVSCAGYRDPGLLAAMAGTVDAISGGRLVLGVGAGFREWEFQQYGYEFGTPGERVRQVGDVIEKLDGSVPLLLAGGGPRMLRLVAGHAAIWHTFADGDELDRQSAILDRPSRSTAADPASTVPLQWMTFERVTTTVAGRVLVLGGGGLTGIAWELGVLVGLRNGGADLTTADQIIGTSAGAFVGALVATGVDLAAAVARLGEIELELPAELDFALVAEGFVMLADRTVPPETVRARIGEIALRAPTSDAAAHVARFSAALPRHEWPEKPRLAVAAVDTATGVLTVWDASAGVPLPEAVAASCAIPAVFPPVPVGGAGVYMDGGVRSMTNADLAAGADAVVVIAPGNGAHRASPAEQLAHLGVARSLLIIPDEAARQAIGDNPLDPEARAPALAAGIAQGLSLAADVARIW